jgi:hypothetical protein
MRNDHLDETRDPRDRAIDDALGQALRAEDPGAAFTQRVLARAREERAAKRQTEEVLAMPPAEVSAAPPQVRARRFTATRKLIAAIAASLTLAAAAEQWMQYRRYVAEGERARAQVLAALRLTNEKLDLVHDKITGREHVR